MRNNWTFRICEAFWVSGKSVWRALPLLPFFRLPSKTPEYFGFWPFFVVPIIGPHGPWVAIFGLFFIPEAVEPTWGDFLRNCETKRPEFFQEIQNEGWENPARRPLPPASPTEVLKRPPFRARWRGGTLPPAQSGGHRHAHGSARVQRAARGCFQGSWASVGLRGPLLRSCERMERRFAIATCESILTVK